MASNFVLVDTTVWIHFLRGTDVIYRERLVPLIVSDRVATTPVIVMEILRGAKSQKEYEKLAKDLAAVRSFDLSAAVWERANRLGYALRQKGINVPLADTLIAAVAQEHNALLLHDDKHYEMIASVFHLQQETVRNSAP